MNEWIQYLKDTAALECQLYTQDRLLNQLYEQASALGNPKNYTEPEMKYKGWKPLAAFLHYEMYCSLKKKYKKERLY